MRRASEDADRVFERCAAQRECASRLSCVEACGVVAVLLLVFVVGVCVRACVVCCLCCVVLFMFACV